MKMPAATKKRILAIAAALTVTAGAAFGYQQIFTKGLDHLPARPCSGAVERSTAASALPTARKAEDRGKLRISLHGQFKFFCYVRTESSVISGEAQSGFASVEDWWAGRDDGTVSVTSGDVRALAFPRLATVYVPCTPEGAKNEPHRAHSLIVEARTIGETRTDGPALRQTVLDFAYQMAKHAYDAGRCQEPQKLPEELPRINSN
jgi:hypothetical protein